MRRASRRSSTSISRSIPSCAAPSIARAAGRPSIPRPSGLYAEPGREGARPPRSCSSDRSRNRPRRARRASVFRSSRSNWRSASSRPSSISHVRVEPVERTVEKSVNLKDERVVIERRPTGAYQPKERDLAPREFEVVERHETPVATKRAVATRKSSSAATCRNMPRPCAAPSGKRRSTSTGPELRAGGSDPQST